ncbi:MAG TPA: sulfite exporter TauE/SafE family protein, partial [Candidatus Sulfopaludibacter sp.]|nr:sulfite exporter TauE/SafE family protein [Candidatus Sulfopaludibacter sp.]
AGALNAIAGGGSFLSFPALIFSGVLPIPANATSTIALWPGSLASAGAYREKTPRSARLVAPLVTASLLGGAAGAIVLLHTPEALFMRLVPYLFLAATLLFTFGGKLSGRNKGLEGRPAHFSSRVIAGVTLTQFIISIYGGFFGGGMGILMLALLAVVPIGDIHSMNGLKSVLAVAINGSAVVTFIAAGAVVWPAALVMILGAVAGGYGGARLAQRLDPRLVRGFVIVLGFAMAGYFLWRY